jgi:hypothetical protein
MIRTSGRSVPYIADWRPADVRLHCARTDFKLHVMAVKVGPLWPPENEVKINNIYM